MEALTYLDTHVVAWLYAGEIALLSPRAVKLINTGELGISPMVTLELQYLREIGRLTVRPHAIIQGLTARIGLQVCEGTFSAVVDAALEQTWTRDPFDRMIVAQAALTKSMLITKDQTIRRHYRLARW